MKQDNIYLVLIYFFIFTSIKKIYDVTVDYKFPTYEDKVQAPDSLQFLFTIRDILATITILYVLYILFTFKVNIFILSILLFFFIHNILYFVVDRRYIYNFIDKKYIDMETIVFIDGTVNNLTNILIIFFTIYVLINIFRSS
jgi:hypothetical protein